MFGRKEPEPPKRNDRGVSQSGLFEIPDDFPATAGADDDGDNDLKAELDAVTSGGKPKAKPKLISSSDLDKMIADSMNMKDIGSDEELSGDDDDPDLLSELQEIGGLEMATNKQESAPAQPEEPSQVFLPTTNNGAILIEERIEMYKLAEANAKATGEAGRARRFNRGLKTLQAMLKQTNGGKNINLNEIPPEVSVKRAQPQPADAVVTETDDKPSHQ